MNKGILSGLEPAKLFEYFERLSGVPHGSGNTDAISALCLDMARELGLGCRRDGANNVVIRKAASPGCEAAPGLILQGHLDMVCAKSEGCDIDMAHEPPRLACDGEWIWAEGTSLGGDNAIGAAMIFAALADDSFPHPELTAVLTSDEETGMDGAFALDCSDIAARRLINLDSEDEGVFTVSCAGGLRADCRVPGVFAPLGAEDEVFCVTVSGLLGGHSGTEINMGRASANALMGRVLFGALEAAPSLRLASLAGGEFDNVICRDCRAVVAIAKGEAAALAAFVQGLDAALKNEYAASDAGVCLSLERAEAARALDADSTKRAIFALRALPQGVMAMSGEFPGLVQTSLNLGVAKLTDAGLELGFALRSCVETQKTALLEKLRAVTVLAGGEVTARADYPGWRYRRVSPLRDALVAAYREQYGSEPKIEAIHAGLECGVFAEKLPGLDAVSLGPELREVHSVRERLNIASAARTYELLRAALAKLARG